MSLSQLESDLVDVIMVKAMEYPDEYNAIGDFPSVSVLYGDNGDPMWSEAEYDKARSAVESAVRNIISPWESIPKPGDFDAPIDELNRALGILSGSANAESIALKENVELEIGGLIPSYMSRVKANLTGWRGETVKALRTNYVRRFGPMIALQCNGLVILRKALEAERVIWEGAHENIQLVLKESATAFDALNWWGNDANLKLAFDIAAAVAGIVGAIVSGPAAAIAVATVGGAVSVSKDQIRVPENPTNIEELPSTRFGGACGLRSVL